MVEEEEDEHCTPQDTELAGDEHGSSHDGDELSQVASTDQERREEAKVGISGSSLVCAVVMWIHLDSGWSLAGYPHNPRAYSTPPRCCLENASLHLKFMVLTTMVSQRTVVHGIDYDVVPTHGRGATQH